MDFTINNVRWKIIETTQKGMKAMQNKRKGEKEEKEDETNLNNRYYGITYADDCIIYLDMDLPIDRKRKTLMHELAHCYIVSYITHEDKTYDEEMVADIVANSHDTITEIINEYFKEACK